MAEAIAALQAYRAQLKRAGRLIEARAVAHCISLVKAPKNRSVPSQHNHDEQERVTQK